MPELFQQISVIFMGLTGFDSEMKWFVSMQCIVGWHYNLRRQKFNWQQ